jgi:nucleoside-diphosphate-sugar epimerase
MKARLSDRPRGRTVAVVNESQPNPKVIVVAGAAGKLGRLVVEALLSKPGVRVRGLVRDPGKPEVASMVRDGLELVAFDAVSANEAARDAAVKDAFAVVSTLQGGPDVIVDAQLALLRAAKRAGARRFVPSDYSYNHFTLPEGMNVNSDWRRALGVAAKEETTASFEVVHVMQGIFADRFVLGFLGMLDAEEGVIRYWGDGKTPIDWTTWEDTARFIAAVALDDRRVPEWFFVSGDRMDVLAFAQAWEEGHGKKPRLERLGSLDDLERETKRQLAAEPANMYAWLPLMYARGMFGGQALLGPTRNERYPEIETESVAQVIARGAL